MKYIDADKLLAEIERRIIEHKKSLKKDITLISEAMLKGSLGAYESTKRFITSLQQEQPDLPSGEEVMTMCNQILIDWVKEGKTPEEVESREEAHSRFFELYDEYITQEQPEVDLEKEIDDYYRENLGLILSQVDTKVIVSEIARHFYEL